MLGIKQGYSVGYLTGPVAGGREGYYSGAVAAGEPPGRWYGAGAEALGLRGEVDADLMEAIYARLLDPRDPATHSRATWDEARALAPAHRKYRDADTIYKDLIAQEPDAGPERRVELLAQAERSARQAVAFEDATFSVPKSVTVVNVAFERAANDARKAGDTQAAEAWAAMQKAVEAAVMAGAKATIDYLQEVGGYSRIGRHGGGAGRWTDAHEFIVAQFLQHDSRDRDPQLHVHQAILNATLGADGEWHRLDGRALRIWKLSAGAIGERVMEAELARTLGLRFATRPDGLAREVVGVSQAVMDLFSQRRRAVTEKTAELVAAYEAQHGREASVLERKHIAQQATLLTRKGKSHDGETEEQRLDRWERESRTAVVGGLGSVARSVLEQRDAGPGDVWSPQDVIERALAGVGKNQGTWNRSDLIWSVSNALPGHLGIPTEQIQPLLEMLADEALAQAVVVREAEDADGLPAEFRLANGRSAYQAPGGARYTTPDQVVAERILERAAVRVGAAALTTEQADHVIRRFAENGAALGADKATAVRGVLTSGAAVEVLSAAAATGKSFTVGVIAEAWAEHGRRTFGLAAGQKAADVLGEEGVRSFNIERWRIELKRDPSLQLREGDLVVVDEAGMASTTDLADIAQRCEHAGAKLLLVGDARQLAAVGPGGAFADLGEQAAKYELTEVWRFNNDWEGDASLRLRDGDITALDAYDRRGRLRSCGTREEAEADASRAWLADTLAGKQSLLLVRDNEGAARVSAQLRAELVRLGRVEDGGVILGRDGTTAGVGDLVQARRNAWDLAGQYGNTRAAVNRETYRVTEVLADGGLRVSTVLGRDEHGEKLGVPLTLPNSYVADRLSLAYATTVHAAQGRTVDTAHGVIVPGADAASGYVMLTRGRESNTAWVVTQPLASDAPVGEAQDVKARAARAVLAEMVERSEDQRGALAEQAQAVEDKVSTMTNVDRLIDGITVMNAGRTSSLLDRLTAANVITPERRVDFAADQAMGSVERLLRHAEVSGHDPAGLLRSVLDGKSLADARSVGQVLHARIRVEVGTVVPTITSYADLIPADADERWRPHLQRLADAADDRRHELGARVAEEPPPWALETLGPVPEDPLRRAVWESRAGWAAAHRENMTYEDEQDPLGSAPPAGLPEKHAVWCTAHVALDLPDIGAEEGGLTDGRLRARVVAYDREKAWAPRWVGDELAATAERAASRRTDAQLWVARAETLAGDEREQLAEAAREAAVEAEELERRTVDLEEADRARARWYAHTAATRDAAERAKAELARRGVDLAAPADATTAQEWLATHREDVTAEEQHRPVVEDDVARDDDVAAVDGVETAAVDIRDVAIADPSEADGRAPERKVPDADDTAEAVRRAREALLEVDARQQADQQREDDEAAERASRWLAAQEQDDTNADARTRSA